MFDAPALSEKNMKFYHELEVAFIDGAEAFVAEVDSKDENERRRATSWSYMIGELAMRNLKDESKLTLGDIRDQEKLHADEFRKCLRHNFNFDDYLREALAASCEFLITPSIPVCIAMFFFVFVTFAAAFFFKISFGVLSIYLLLGVAIFFIALNAYSFSLFRRIVGKESPNSTYSCLARVVDKATVDEYGDGSLKVMTGERTLVTNMAGHNEDIKELLTKKFGWDEKTEVIFQPSRTEYRKSSEFPTFKSWVFSILVDCENKALQKQKPAKVTIGAFSHCVQFILYSLGYSVSRLLFSPYIWIDYPIIAWSCFITFVLLVVAMYFCIGTVMIRTVSILAVPPNADKGLMMSLMKILLNDRAYKEASNMVEDKRGKFNPELEKSARAIKKWDDDF